MKIRELFSDPLVMRELASQARRPGSGHWSYAGPGWWLLLSIIPLYYLCFHAFSRPEDSFIFWTVAAVWQTWLLLLRSGIYAAGSIALDVEQGTFSVLSSSIIGVGRSIVSKVVASLLPLELELVASTVLYLVVFGLLGRVAMLSILLLGVYQFSLSLLGAGVGLLLGVFCGQGKAATSSFRTIMVLLVPVCFGLCQVWTDSYVYYLVLIMLLAFVLPKAFPGSVPFCSVSSLVLIVALPLLGWTANGCLELKQQGYQSGHFLAVNPAGVVLSFTEPVDFHNSGRLLRRIESEAVLRDFCHRQVKKTAADRVSYYSLDSSLMQISANPEQVLFYNKLYQDTSYLRLSFVSLIQAMLALLFLLGAYLQAQRQTVRE